MAKRYYWLKLKEGFFRDKAIKKLRRQAGGDTSVIIYLKMQLLAMKSDGILSWTGLEDSFAEELALDLDEEPDRVEVTLAYLLKTGLAETMEDGSLFLPDVLENTGSEGASAQRWRDWKERQKALESDTLPTDGKCIADGEKERETEIEKEKKTAAPPEIPGITRL